VRAPACTSIVRKGRLGFALGRIGSRRNKRKEAPNTCTLRPHVSHHDLSLPCLSTARFLSQVCIAPFTSPLSSRAARDGPLQALHRPIPLFDLQDVASVPARPMVLGRDESLFSAPPPSRLPFRSTPRLTSIPSATSALTYTRSDPTARPDHLDSCHTLITTSRRANARLTASPLLPSLVRTVPSFVRRALLCPPADALTRGSRRQRWN
jgi:hypothetical protein